MIKKVKGVLIFLAIVGLLFLFDYVRSQLFTISLVEVVPSPIPADGTTPVSIKARITKNGEPVQGHDLYIVSHSGGNFSPYRINSDKSGEVVYTYYPYRVSPLNPLQDITVQITDESNSIFMEVNAKGKFTIPAVAPDGEDELFTIDLFWN
jgi:hypothetical protein